MGTDGGLEWNSGWGRRGETGCENGSVGVGNDQISLTKESNPGINLKYTAPVAQLDRAPGFEPVGRRFESCRARHVCCFRFVGL